MKLTNILLACSLLPTFAMASKQTSPDSDMATVLDAFKAKNPKPISTLDPAEARKQPTPADATMTVITKTKGKFEPVAMKSVKEIQLSGAAGEIPARVYVPKEGTNLPVIVYYHGGGFVIATNDTYDASARALAKQSDAIVVAVEYRKAPEHKFPAAHDDAFAAYKWVLANAASLGGDAKKVAVAGESAGGNLALNVALRARDEKVQLPTHELLIYPVAGSDMSTESYRKNADAKPLDKATMQWFVKNYTRTPADAQDPRMNLMSANFKGLNSATIITAEIDPLMTEGKKLAERLKGQGVEVDYKNYDGVTHEFFGMAPVVNDAVSAQSFASENLKESFKM